MVCSILIALWLDSWREGRMERHAAADAAYGLNAEIDANLQELRRMRDDVAERRERLAALGDSLRPGEPFVTRMGSFVGFRTPDLSRSAWERASLAAIANRLDAAYMRDAFAVYHSEDLLAGLDDRISDVAFGEAFYLPERARAAWLVSVAIMEQQANWLADAIPLHERFIATYAPDLVGQAP